MKTGLLGLTMLALLGLCLALPAEATVRVGIKAGPNFADISGDLNSAAPYKPKPGLIVGGLLEWTTTKAMVLRPGIRLEALYVQKGWKDQVNQVDENAREQGWITVGTVHIDELVIAPSLVVRLPLGVVVPYALVGPEAGLHLSSKEKLKAGGDWVNPWAWKKDPNFGLNVGAGVAFNQWIGEMVIEGRYNLGLSDMTGANSESVKKIKTNGIQLFLGYNFTLVR